MYAPALSFDTYEYIKEFKKAGIPEAQAVLFVKTLKDSRDYDFSKLATQEQIALFKQETKNDIEKLDHKIEYLRKETKTDVDRLEQKIEASRNESKADIGRLEQKIEHIEEKMTTKDDLAKLETQMITIFKSLEIQMAKFEAQIAKQDSQQKAWMMGIFLSIIAMIGTLFFKLD